MVLMSVVCGSSTAGLCGEWLPLYSADGFWSRPIILLGVPSMIFG